MTNVELTPEPLAPAVIAAGAPPLSSPARDARMAPLAAEPPDAFALIEAAHAQIAKTLVAATGEFAARTFKHQSSMELAREIGVLTLSLARVARMLEPPKAAAAPARQRTLSRFAERRAAHFAYFAEAEPPAPAAAQPPAEENCDFPPMRMWSGGKLYRDEEEFSNDYRAARRARVQEKATERSKRDGIDYRAALDIEYAEWEHARRKADRRDETLRSEAPAPTVSSGEAAAPRSRAGTQLEGPAPLPLQGACEGGRASSEARAGDSASCSNGVASPEPSPHKPDNMNAPAATTALIDAASACGNAEDAPSNIEHAGPLAPIQGAEGEGRARDEPSACDSGLEPQANGVDPPMKIDQPTGHGSNA